MPEITTKAGPWDMTVYVCSSSDPANPIKNLGLDGVSRLPFGAFELDTSGHVLSYVDTEPHETHANKLGMEGKSFFNEVCRWSAGSLLEDEFKKGISTGVMNTGLDCAVEGLRYKVRIHLKISPILSTYWIFIKQLRRD